MQVKDIMTPSPATCTADKSLQEAARLMVQHDCGAIPVLEPQDARHPTGIITDRDITTRTVAQGKNPLQMHVHQVMTSSVATVNQEVSVEECAQQMEKNQVRRMLVTDENGSCVGIVAQADLARKASPEQTEEVVEEVSRSSGKASRQSRG